MIINMKELIVVGCDTVLIGLLLGTLIIKKYRKYFVIQKIICSLFFVGISIWFGSMEKWNLNFMFLFPGFVLCFLGDVALGWYNKNRNKKYFLCGVLLFLLGHIAFITSSCREMKLTFLNLLLPALSLLFILYQIKRKEMALGKLQPYCLLYTFFVVLMCEKNLLLLMNAPSYRTALLGIGGILFLISDYLILYLYFVRKRKWPTHGINLVTYYYGILCMVLSLLY